jgi:hypothetical protein
MTNKQLSKLAVISTIVVGIIVTIYIGINVYKNYIIAQKVKVVGERAEQFSTALFTYTKESDTSYLLTLEPYMTKALYAATYYVNTMRPQDFVGELPSTVESSKASGVVISNDTATAKVDVVQNEKGSASKTVGTQIDLVLENNVWKISNFR